MAQHAAVIEMSWPSWQRHRAGCRWSPVRTLPLPPVAFATVAPLWCQCDLARDAASQERLLLNSHGIKTAANLRLLSWAA